MATIPNTRGNPQASDVAVQTALPMVGSASREDLQATLGFVDSELAKLFEDRNIQIVDGGLISYLGTSVEFTQPLKLHINSKVAGGSPTVVDLTSTTRNFPNNGDMWYITLDRGAGTATHTIAATLPAVTSANQEIILIAKRSDSADGLKRLYFRNGSGYDEGQTARLGSSGSGAGDANSLLETFKNRLVDSNYTLMTPYVTAMDNDDLLDVGNSSAAYSLVDKTINFTGINQIARTIQLADANEFLNNTDALSQVELMVQWRLANIDTAATYEVTRNGSIVSPNWQAITMSRVGSTDLYRGVLTFADEVTNQTLHSPAISGDLNASNELSASFTISSGTKQLLKKVVLNLTKTGSPSGNFFVSICANNGGSPGTVLAESNAVLASSVSTGNNTIDIPDLYLAAGTYHVKVRTDAAYKASYLNSTTELNLSSSTVEGITIDLRVRITSSIATAKLEGLGLFYNLDANSISTSTAKQQETFTFTGASNTYNFTITKFIPDPDLLKVYDVNTGQVYTNGAFSISGQVVSFTSGQFLSSEAYVTLVFDQTIGGSFDNSDVNQLEIDQLQESVSDLSYVSVPKISVPYTSIVNRAQIPDLSQDLKPRMGVERVMIQQIYPIQGEFGPNGEPVWGALNDTNGLVRCYGTWLNFNQNGVGIYTATNGDAIEITFYGTGLNLVTYAAFASLRTASITIDGVASGTWTESTASTSNIIGLRNYASNVVLNVVSGLTLGLHTIRLAQTSNNLDVFGYEVLNESSSVKTQPGTAYINGKKSILQQQDSYVYNAIATGTKGGRVVEYLNADGTIGEAFQAVDASSLTLSSANHANEEVVRTHHWREFGASRTSTQDDFSLATAASGLNLAFTLDDGTTTLVGSSVGVLTNELGLSGNGGFVTLTFIGTGLDIIRRDTANGGADSYTVQIDGGSAIALPSAGINTVRQTKIVSGLAYGTHTVRINRVTAATWQLNIQQFIIYGPKKPSIPSGAMELADYNVMANFDGTTATGTAAADIIQMPTGTLSKFAAREFFYSGANWQINPIDTTTLGGFVTGTLTNNSQPVSYTFFGTGFSILMNGSGGGTYDFTVTIDGALNAAGVVRANATNLGGGSYRASSGSTIPIRVEFTGLSLGRHTVSIARSAGTGNFSFQALHIITPIHSPKSNLYGDIQNTLPVGSCGISDNRKTDPLQHIKAQTSKAWTQAIGIAVSPTTTSIAYVPMPDMSVTIKAGKSGRLKISYSASVYTNTVGSGAYTTIFLDGVQIGQDKVANTPISGYIYLQADHISVPVSEGVHKVDVYWKSGGGTAQTYTTMRNMLVEWEG